MSPIWNYSKAQN